MNDTYAIFKNKLFYKELFSLWGLRHAYKDIVRIVKDNRCETVLEVCCGAGKLAEKMTKCGMKVTGIDRSKTMLDRAIKKKRARRLILQDATKMDFKEQFDVAIVQIALHEMIPATRAAVFNNMKMAVKRRGLLIISDFAHTTNKSVNSRINGWFVRKGEEGFLATNPEHYHNYKEFVTSGGVKEFLKDENIISENYFMGGHVGVIAITN